MKPTNPLWSIWLSALFITSWLTASSPAGTVVYWQFEPDNIGADSSGNFFDLSVTGITSSTDKHGKAPGTGSAVFSGSGSAQTFSSLDLSSYEKVTIEWFMKTEQPAGSLGVIFELSSNYNSNSGSLISYMNEGGVDQLVFGNLTGAGYSIRETSYPRDGQWHHYALTVDVTATDETRQRIYIDGEEVQTIGGVLGAGGPQPLGNHVLFLGARNGANFFLQGLIDEFRISDEILDPDEFLSPVSYPDASVTIGKHPADLTVLEHQNINLGQEAILAAEAVVANAPASALRYQWEYKAAGATEWTSIEGADQTAYVISDLSRAQDGARYRVVVRVIGSAAEATSQEAVLTIVPDEDPPQIISAGGLGGSVGICFNERLDLATAELASNYAIEGATISGAKLREDGRSVELTASGVAGAFTLTVKGVADWAGNVMPGTNLSGELSSFASVDIAPEFEPPFEAGSAFACGAGALEIAAGGADIWGLEDSFHFTHEVRTGDFDIRVQVEDFDGGSFFAKAGLMAREDATSGSRNVAVVVYPTRGIWAASVRAETGGATTQLGDIVDWNGHGAAYPNIWLRLQRAGNVLRVFWGTDGETWNLIGQASPELALPETMLVGLAVTAAHDEPGVTASAQYRNLSDVEIGAVAISITEQPQDVTLRAGATARFSVQAEVSGASSDELSYQWQKDGVDISGAVSSSYVTSILDESHSGARYRVILRVGTNELVSEEALLIVEANPALVQRSISGIAVFQEDTRTLNNRGDEANAIDGDIGSFSYLTPSGTTSPQVIALGLSETPQLVNRIRVAKVGDTDAVGGTIDNMDLEVWFSSDTGPLEQRRYRPVTGLTSGYQGTELIRADEVSSDGRIDNDHHHFPAHGFYALTFDAANATAVALRLERDAGDPYRFTHYPTYEFEIYNDAQFGSATITVVEQPQNATVDEFSRATFEVEASAEGAPATALSYQWQKDGTDIPGATEASYTTPPVSRGDEGAAYRSRISLGDAVVFSEAGILTVIRDEAAPVLLSAASYNGTKIGLCFSEEVDRASASDAANYILTTGGTVSAAAVLEDGKFVELTVSGLTGQEFAVEARNIADLAGNAAQSLMVTGGILSLSGVDIAPEFEPPFEMGAAFSCEVGDIDVSAGGRDIFGNEDSFHFIYGERTGDFDVRVQIAGMQGGSLYAKAGLMAREDITPGSRNVNLVVYPTRQIWAGALRQESGGPTAQLGPVIGWGDEGIRYPDVWSRLKREGNTFKLYWGGNGEDWQLLAETTPEPAYPETILVGLATSAAQDAPGVRTAAAYRNFGETPLVPARIAEQPVGASKIIGSSYTFQVIPGGSDPFTFQWQKDGQEIPGATGQSLVLTNLGLEDAGEYRVVVRNPQGQAVSEAAVLIVVPPAFKSETVELTGIAVFRADTFALNNRGDQASAIDGNVQSGSYLTPSGSDSPHIVAVDFGDVRTVSRVRVAKSGNIDGLGGTDNMDLEILYTTDSGPLESRSYNRVGGLASGYLGEEAVQALSVDSDGRVENDHHDFATGGWFSLRFTPVPATGLAIRFARDAGDGLVFTHYLVQEIEAYLDEPIQDIALELSAVRVFDASGTESTRADAANAIDGALSTVTYLTQSGTASPQIAAFELGTIQSVNRLRVAKGGDIDGLPPAADRMDLEILYSTGSGDLADRTYQAVTGLVNGYGGTELIQAEEVMPDGRVDNETHDFDESGFYSLSFDTVNATAIAIRITRDSEDPHPFTHYRVFEVQALLSPAAMGSPEPRLQMAQQADGTILLRWPESNVHFVLESKNILGSGEPWSPVEVAPELLEGHFHVRVSATVQSEFYRLRSVQAE